MANLPKTIEEAASPKALPKVRHHPKRRVMSANCKGILFCATVIGTLLCTTVSCTSTTDDRPNDTRSENDNRSKEDKLAYALSEFNTVVSQCTRLEYTVALTKPDKSQWRVGPVLVTNEDDIVRIKKAIRFSLKEIDMNVWPHEEPMLGTACRLVFVKKSADQFREDPMRMVSPTEMGFFGGESYSAYFKDKTFYDAICEIALKASEEDPTLEIQLTRVSRPAGDRHSVAD